MPAAAGDAPGGRHPWPRGDGPPRHTGPPPRDRPPRHDGPPRYDDRLKRDRELEIDVVDRIETVTADDVPPKRHHPGRGGSHAGNGPPPRMPRDPPGGPARGGMRDGSYDEAPPRDGVASGRRGPTRWEAAAAKGPPEGEPRRDHPAEALRRSRDAPRPHDNGADVQPLPGPPPVAGQPPRPDMQQGGGGGGAAAGDDGPNFGLSGVLAADSKRNQRGTVQKYSPPDDACTPTSRWRIYIYKGRPMSGVFSLTVLVLEHHMLVRHCLTTNGTA